MYIIIQIYVTNILEALMSLMDEYADVVFGYCLGKGLAPDSESGVLDNVKRLAKIVREGALEELCELTTEDDLEVNVARDTVWAVWDRYDFGRRKTGKGDEEKEGDDDEADEDEDEEEKNEEDFELGVDPEMQNFLEDMGLTFGTYGEGEDLAYSIGLLVLNMRKQHVGTLDVTNFNFEEATRILEDIRPLLERAFGVDLQTQKPQLHVSIGRR
jgi:hypothetical protein